MAVTLLMLTSTSDLDSVPAVRRFATQVVEAFDVGVDPFTVALLTTELVANAVRAAAGDVTTSFVREPDVIRIVVHDNGGGLPVLGHPQPLDDDGGRGLMIVNALADAWGSEASSRDGTTVWFELERDADGASRRSSGREDTGPRRTAPRSVDAGYRPRPTHGDDARQIQGAA